MHQRLLSIFAGSILLISFYSCNRHTVRNASFNKELWEDTTLIISDYIQSDKPIEEGWMYMGPYFVQFGKGSNASRKLKNTPKFENSDLFQFSICKDSLCAYAYSTFYEKIKPGKEPRPIVTETNDMSVGGAVATTAFLGAVSTLMSSQKIKTQNISGLIYYGIQPAMVFQVNRIGKRNGHGYFRLSERQILGIRPIKKKTRYNVEANAVGLEYVIDNKVIGSFMQSDGIVRIVLKRSLDAQTKLILSALSMSLISRIVHAV